VTELSYREAVTAGLAAELERDPAVVVLGEDVILGGVWVTTPGLAERFPGRVIDTPISELAFTGAAFGAAVRGLRPVVEIMFGDFLWLVTDTLVNQASKYWYLSNGQGSVPLTVRTAVGAGGRFGACHSQTPTGALLGEPGLKLVCPATPGDAYALTRAAVQDDNPVVVFEHKFLYGRKGEVDEQAPVERIGRAALLRRGDDVTIVAALAAVEKAVAAADVLEEDGIGADVIDLRSLRPLDAETIAGSVARTGRLVVVEDAPPLGGYAAEVVAAAAEAGPVRALRVSMPDLPLPASMKLEDAALTSVEQIVRAASALADTGVPA
jgi:acetoin:2,6-dichlorophenolindophenol oxidoreductase subunit beta